MNTGSGTEKLRMFGDGGAEAMRKKSAAVVGLGALGSVSALLLSRFPLGRLVLLDRDIVEKKNIGRQWLYSEEDASDSLPKAEAAKARLERFACCPLEARDVNLDAEQAELLFGECDIVVDATDNFDTRYMMNEASVKHRKPWVYGGVLGSGGSSLFIDHTTGPCLRCVFGDTPAVGAEESCDTTGIHPSAPTMIASFQASEAAKFLAGKNDRVERGFFDMDLQEARFATIKVAKDPECPVCGAHEFPRLDNSPADEVRELCGGESVLIMLKGRKFDLSELERRLKSEGAVFSNRFLLRFEKEGVRMTIHSDGRVLVHGIPEGKKAMSYASRALGL